MKLNVEEKLALSVKEAAAMLGLCEDYVRQLTHRADFPAIRVGRRVIIPKDKLNEWLGAHSGEQI